MSGLLDSGGSGAGGSFEPDDTGDNTTHTEETYTGGLVDEGNDSATGGDDAEEEAPDKPSDWDTYGWEKYVLTSEGYEVDESWDGGSTDDSSGDSFDPDENTLGTDYGEFTDGDDEEVTVEESDSDPSDSSPAGGAGLQDATERFTNAEDGALDDASRDELLDEAQEASDAYSDGETYEGEENDQNNQSDDAGDGIAANVDAKKALAAAGLVGLLVFGGN